jgi:hypothetical protein
MERLAPELRRELGRLGPNAELGPLAEAWPHAVGAAIAANAWPARLMRDGTLVIHTRDSVWAFELTQRADEIRGRLQPDAPTGLKFVAGPVPEPSSEPAGKTTRHVVEPGPAELNLAGELAAVIEDENLRKVVAKAAAFALARGADHRFV